MIRNPLGELIQFFVGKLEGRQYEAQHPRREHRQSQPRPKPERKVFTDTTRRLLLVLDAERTKAKIQNLRSEGKISFEMVSLLSSTSVMMALWQGTLEKFNKKLVKSFNYTPK